MQPSFVNAVYYPFWHIYRSRPPSLIPTDRVTHVFYAFISPNPDGSLRLLDPRAETEMLVDGESGCLAALARLRLQNQSPGQLRTLVSVGGGGSREAFAALAANEETRERFATEIKSFLDQWGLDGVDIDWEHPTCPETGRNYSLLLAALRAHLPRPRYLVTTALPVGTYCLAHVDWAIAARDLDLVNVMGYDFVGPWTGYAGHHSQLRSGTGDQAAGANPDADPDAGAGADPGGSAGVGAKSCEGGVEYILSRGFPADKIALGVPAYARYFENAAAPGDPSTVAGEVEYCKLGEDVLSRVEVDRALGTAWAVQAEGLGFVSLDVPETVVLKARFVREMGLAGLFYWHVFGDLPGEASLIRAGWEGLSVTE